LTQVQKRHKSDDLEKHSGLEYRSEAEAILREGEMHSSKRRQSVQMHMKIASSNLGKRLAVRKKHISEEEAI
jgi:hypothetical protein